MSLRSVTEWLRFEGCARLNPCYFRLHSTMSASIPHRDPTSGVESLSRRSSQMPAVKRHRDGAEKEKEVAASPFMPMFESFRDELDEHHDRRERIIKASRDITAASKKM